LETWEYRIIKHDTDEGTYFAVHEVFYDESGEIKGWTENPVSFGGDSEKELHRTLQTMIKDCKKPVLSEVALIKANE
jgi:hypothetical protein